MNEAPAITCQCPRWERSCDNRPSQEDLLCNTCRTGRCATATFNKNDRMVTYSHTMVLIQHAGSMEVTPLG